MDTIVISVIALLAFFILMALGMPIAFAFALAGAAFVIIVRGLGPALSLLGSAPFTWAGNSSFLAVPLFILMGQFVYRSGISGELYDTSYKWIGRFPGGLALATTLACTGFAACSGVSVAASSAMSSIAFPEMKRFNYHPQLATGCIAGGGSLSCLIPPSAPFIIYGALTETSIAKLFIAGIFPGLLLAGLYMLVIIIMCLRNPALGPAGPSHSWREMLASLKGLLGVFILFLIVIGGLFIGVFTPSEAGTIGAFGALVICLAKRQLSKSNLVDSLKDSITNTSFILTILIGAMIFSNFLTVAGFTSTFSGWIKSLQLSPHLIMICIFFIYIVLGTFMDGAAMLMITLPIVFPIAEDLGFDLVWFGVMLILLVEMALITPPVGLNSYIVHGMTGVPLSQVFRGILPFFGMMVVCLIFLYAFPQIILFLPSVMR